jgi:hypothetical protein
LAGVSVGIWGVGWPSKGYQQWIITLVLLKGQKWNKRDELQRSIMKRQMRIYRPQRLPVWAWRLVSDELSCEHLHAKVQDVNVNQLIAMTLKESREAYFEIWWRDTLSLVWRLR